MTDVKTDIPDGDKTPAVVLIGDIIAQGLKRKLSESLSITSANAQTGTLDNVLVADAAVWPQISNTPWFVVCIGTQDRRTDYYRLLNFRARLNRLPNSISNKHVIWVLPMNNSAAANAVRLVAKKYNDIVFDPPRVITTTTTIPYQVPIYTQQWVPPAYGWIWWPYSYGIVRAGYWQNVFLGYQIQYKTVTNREWLSEDGKQPNDGGYTWIRDKLRSMTDNWGMQYDEDA